MADIENFRRAAHDNLLWGIKSAPVSEVMVLADTVQSDTNLEQYDSFHPAPAAQEIFSGPVEFEPGISFEYTLTNQMWALGISIHKNAFDDDRLGAFQNQIRQMGTRMEQLKYEQVLQALWDGDGAASYDGSNFFANTHTDWTGDNALTVAVAAGDSIPTLAEMESAYEDARASLFEFTDPKGKTIHYGVNDMTLVHGPRLETVVNRVNGNQLRTAGESNVHQGRFTPILATTNNDTATQKEFILAKTEAGRRPLIFQDRQGVEDKVIDFDENLIMKWIVTRRFTVGYNAAYSAVKHDFTT